MKKVIFFSAVTLILGMMVVSCEKSDDFAMEQEINIQARDIDTVTIPKVFPNEEDTLSPLDPNGGY